MYHSYFSIMLPVGWQQLLPLVLQQVGLLGGGIEAQISKIWLAIVASGRRPHEAEVTKQAVISLSSCQEVKAYGRFRIIGQS
jgi:hypothetical protein